MFSNNNFLFQIIKGVIISIIICLVSVLVFAYAIKLFSLPSSIIKPVNQVVKVVAVTIGCLLSVRPPKGFVKGLLIGFFSVFLEYLIFGIISKSLGFGVSEVLDLLFGGVMGILAGIICSNIKKSY